MIDIRFQDHDEGLILLGGANNLFGNLDPKMYMNTTGGTFKNKREAEGHFIYLPIPQKVKELMCCNKIFRGSARDEDDIKLQQEVNLAFIGSGISFRADYGEEAWLLGDYVGPQGLVSAIATWPNCSY